MKKQVFYRLMLLFVLITLFFSGCGGGNTPPSTAILENIGDSVQGNGFGADPGSTTTEILRYQTFIANDYPVLTQVELKLRRFGAGTPNDVLVRLMKTDENRQPTGTPLATATIPASSIPTYNPDDFTQVAVNLVYNGLGAGQEYAIVVGQVLNESFADGFPHYELVTGIYNQTPWRSGNYVCLDNSTDSYSWNDETSSLGTAWIRLHVAKTANITPETQTIDFWSDYYPNPFKTGKEDGYSYMAQIFEATAYPKLIEVELIVRKINSPSALAVHLYSLDVDGIPALLLASGSLSASSISTSMTKVTVPLSYNHLVSGAHYAILVGQSIGNDTDFYEINRTKLMPVKLEYCWTYLWYYGWSIKNDALTCQMKLHLAK